MATTRRAWRLGLCSTRSSRVKIGAVIPPSPALLGCPSYRPSLRTSYRALYWETFLALVPQSQQYPTQSQRRGNWPRRSSSPKKATVHPAICLIVSQQSILSPEKLSAALAVNRQTPIGRSKTSFKIPSAKTTAYEFRSASAYLTSARKI